jgi:hypothetical protein
MESNQIHLVAAAVFGHTQQVIDTLESGFTRQVVGDFVYRDRVYGIHHDVAVVHAVAAADFDMATRPDANAAFDAAALDAVAQAFRKHHRESPAARAACAHSVGCGLTCNGHGTAIGRTRERDKPLRLRQLEVRILNQAD